MRCAPLSPSIQPLIAPAYHPDRSSLTSCNTAQHTEVTQTVASCGCRLDAARQGAAPPQFPFDARRLFDVSKKIVGWRDLWGLPAARAPRCGIRGQNAASRGSSAVGSLVEAAPTCQRETRSRIRFRCGRPRGRQTSSCPRGRRPCLRWSGVMAVGNAASTDQVAPLPRSSTSLWTSGITPKRVCAGTPNATRSPRTTEPDVVDTDHFQWHWFRV